MPITVMTPARKRQGVSHPATATEYSVDIVVGQRIQTYRKGVLGAKFQMGALAEYDSYNLSYTGTIKAITDRTVTITSRGRDHRLNLHEFCWRNWNFDAALTAARNAETSLCI